MAEIRSFRDLMVYRASFEAAMELFELSKKFPPEEKYSLTDQMRRASRSVCSNTAEAWRKRRYPAAFVSKLSDADSEAAEVSVWLDFALHCRYLSEKAHVDLHIKYDRINAQLYKMMCRPNDWCIPPNK